MLAASAGVVIATTQEGTFSLAGLVANARANALPYGLALTGAVAWALYSNLARRWGGRASGAPLFLVASGLAILPLRFVFQETTSWSPRLAVEFLYMSLIVTVTAYVFWDHAMRKGNLVLVAAFSYFTPLLSTLVTALYLAVVPGPAIWTASVLVVAGAVICRLAIVEEPGVARSH